MSEELAVSEFEGLGDHISPVTRKPAFHQEDLGGSRERVGTWAVRRGIEHTQLEQVPGEVAALQGFETVDGTIAYAIVAGTSVYRGDAAEGAGFGVGGFGEGGFGE